MENWLTNAPVLTMHQDLSSGTEALTLSRVSCAGSLGSSLPAQPASVCTRTVQFCGRVETRSSSVDTCLPRLLTITQKSEDWSRFYGEYNPLAKDLAMNSQIPQHGWKGCTEISLTWLPALTGTAWRKSEASLLLHFMNNTLPGKVAEDNHQLLNVQLDALLTHHMPVGPVFTNTSLDLIPRESRILSVTNSAVTF